MESREAMENLTEKIDELFAQNKGAEAEQLLDEALQQAYEKQDFRSAVPILNELIGYCRETSQVERSYDYAKQVLLILEKLELKGTLPYATTLLNVANAYRAGGRLMDSLKAYTEVEADYEKLLTKDDTLWASLYNNKSLLFQEMGRHDLAKESLLNALSIVVQKKDTIFEQAVTYANLAASCLQLGQGEEAEKYFTGAILLFEKYNIKDTHYCAALSSMGTHLYQKKEYEKAESYFVKAMEGIEAHLGKNEYYYRMQENVKICREAAKANSLEKEVVKAFGADNTEEVQKSKGMEEILVTKNADAQKGMTLCREYYEAYGKPMLEKEFPKYLDKIAVGLIGEGSDCFGYDDVLSRDHDWGPRFQLFVTEQTYLEIGKKLEEAYEKLPKEFQGHVYQETAQGQGRQGVLIIQEFFRELLGAENCPVEEQWDACDIHWENLEEDRLAAAVNGEIFVDKEGILTEIRRVLKEEYPQWLKLTKIAESMARFSQAGQYNYGRMLKRGDKVAAQLMLTEAVKEALKLLYYAIGEYPPHEKWLYFGACQNQKFAQIVKPVEQVVADAGNHRTLLFEEIAKELALLLYQSDIISDVESYLEAHVGELLFKAMASKHSDKELAEEIAKIEFQAFDKVKNQGGRADCQDDWFTFSIMRKSQYYTWNRRMLLQYYYDFSRELERGHNLIEEKYGRMMESTAPSEYEKLKKHFPMLSEEKKQIVESIVAMQVKWMEEFAGEYPNLAGNARSIHTYEDHMWNTSYETYLRGEISTYSDKMLELYGRYIVEYARNGKNSAKDIMEQSVLMYGYESLAEAEAGMRG